MKKYTEAIVNLIESEIIIPLSHAKKQTLIEKVNKILKNRDKIKRMQKAKTSAPK